MITLFDIISVLPTLNLRGAQFSPDTPLRRFVHDPASVEEGDVFIAATVTKEENNGRWYQQSRRIDGWHLNFHDGIAEAVARGAKVILCEDIALATDKAVFIQVPRVVPALATIARELVKRRGIKVIGVTGSSGKTSVVHALCEFLLHSGARVAKLYTRRPTPISLPREICTTLALHSSLEYLIAEYPIDHEGCMKTLLDILPADVGIVLNVRDAHLNWFQSKTAIAAEKAVLVKSLRPEGIAILNADDSLVAAMQADTKAHVLTYSTGSSANASVRVEHKETFHSESRLEVSIEQNQTQIVVNYVGAPAAEVIAPIVSCAFALGIPQHTFPASAQLVKPMDGRMSWHQVSPFLTLFNNSGKMAPTNLVHLVEAIEGVTWKGRRVLFLASVESNETPSPDRSVFSRLVKCFDDVFVVDYPQVEDWLCQEFGHVQLCSLERVRITMAHIVSTTRQMASVICMVGSEYSHLREVVV